MPAGKTERDALRRDQILEAARRCAARSGFHGTSMATMAAEAGMSVGQIYRHFDSKESIIEAIVDRIVSQREAQIDNVHADGALLAPQLLAQLSQEQPVDEAERAVMLEVQAEGARNAKVAAMLQRADRRLATRAIHAVRGLRPDWSEADAAARVEVVAVLAEGTALRFGIAAAQPPARMRELYEKVLAVVFAG